MTALAYASAGLQADEFKGLARAPKQTEAREGTLRRVPLYLAGLMAASLGFASCGGVVHIQLIAPSEVAPSSTASLQVTLATPIATSTSPSLVTQSAAEMRGTILFGGVGPGELSNGLWIFGLDATCLLRTEDCHSDWVALVVPEVAGPSLNQAYHWSPDGSKIVFLSDRGGSDIGDFSIFVMQADGAGQTEILDPDNGSIRSAQWSPKGDWIVYEVIEDSPTIHAASHLGLVRPDGSEQRTLSDAMITNSLPSWSPSGDTIAFLGNDSDANGPVLFLMDVDTGGFRSIADGIQPIHATYPPDWSSEGSRLLFAGEVAGTEDLFVVDVSSGVATNLTNDPTIDRNPLWSPDDSLIAYASVRGKSLDLVLLDPESGESRTIEPSPRREGFPTWSPDGSYLVFQVSDDEAEVSYLKVVSVDGTVSVRLTGSDLSVLGYPSWSP